MDDVKDKMKGFMKKVNNPFSSSSSTKFKGQGRVLGSSSSSTPTNPIVSRPSQTLQPKQDPKPTSSSNPRPSNPPITKPQDPPKPPNPNTKPNGFDPFDSLISPSDKRSQNGYSLNLFECPICTQSFRSEDEVSIHIDTCIGANKDSGVVETVVRSELETCIGAFVSGGASEGAIEIVLKLLRNVVKEPENVKFRRVRMGNPKIREAVGDVAGGVELLECVGFELKEESGEMWAAMDVPSEERVLMIREAVLLLESPGGKCLPVKEVDERQNFPVKDVAEAAEPAEPKKIDRQVRVFFSVPESVAAKIDLPESFYNLSVDELRREADLRKKKIADSQLLIPKSYKERQAKAARRRYKNTVLRIQFPDGVVLQGVFLPWEPTTALYEFVSSSLKQPCLEFELWHPAVLKRRMVPRFPGAGEKMPTLDEEDLVPAALVKFKPIETDAIVFTGLTNELFEISEPLK